MAQQGFGWISQVLDIQRRRVVLKTLVGTKKNIDKIYVEQAEQFLKFAKTLNSEGFSIASDCFGSSLGKTVVPSIWGSEVRGLGRAGRHWLREDRGDTGGIILKRQEARDLWEPFGIFSKLQDIFSHTVLKKEEGMAEVIWDWEIKGDQFLHCFGTKFDMMSE